MRLTPRAGVTNPRTTLYSGCASVSPYNQDGRFIDFIEATQQHQNNNKYQTATENRKSSPQILYLIRALSNAYYVQIQGQ